MTHTSLNERENVNIQNLRNLRNIRNIRNLKFYFNYLKIILFNSIIYLNVFNDNCMIIAMDIDYILYFVSGPAD